MNESMRQGERGRPRFTPYAIRPLLDPVTTVRTSLPVAGGPRLQAAFPKRLLLRLAPFDFVRLDQITDKKFTY